jgi:hypothetical protein
MSEFTDVSFEYVSDPSDQPHCPVCGCIVDEPNNLCLICEEMGIDMKYGIYEPMWPAMRTERECSFADTDIPF